MSFCLGFVILNKSIDLSGALRKKNEDLNYSSLISWANFSEHLLCAWDIGKRKAQALPLRSSQYIAQRVSIWGLCIS